MSNYLQHYRTEREELPLVHGQTENCIRILRKLRDSNTAHLESRLNIPFLSDFFLEEISWNLGHSNARDLPQREPPRLI